MIKTLAARGFIDREPGTARSIRLRLTRAQFAQGRRARRRPGLRRQGTIDEDTGDLPLCGDHGMIHGWEDTLWNRDAGAPPPSTVPPSTATH